MKSNAKYWLISGGLQILIIRLILITAFTLATLYVLKQNNLLEPLLKELQNLISLWLLKN